LWEIIYPLGLGEGEDWEGCMIWVRMRNEGCIECGFRERERERDV